MKKKKKKTLRMSTHPIPIKQITTNPYQPRSNFNDENIAELAESIKNIGIVQPITVRKIEDNKFQLIAGERRLLAAQSAGLHEVPVVIIEADNLKSFELAQQNISKEFGVIQSGANKVASIQAEAAKSSKATSKAIQEQTNIKSSK